MNELFEYVDNCPACGSSEREHYMTSYDVYWYREVFTTVECVECGLVYTPLRPTMYHRKRLGFNNDDKEQQGFYKSISRPHLFKQRDAVFNKILSYKPDSETLFEAGCGDGVLMKVAKDYGLTVEGCDLHRFHTWWCNNVWDVRTLNVETHEVNFKKQVDIFVMMDYLEHTYHLTEDLTKAYNALKPDGVLYVRTLYLESPRHIEQGDEWDQFFLEHFNYFPEKTLIELIERHGFTVEKIIRGSTIEVIARK